MSRFPVLSPLAGAVALILALPVAAEPALSATDLDTVHVQGQRLGYKADVTRSATRTDTLLVDVPQSVTIVTDELIRDQAMTSMADVVRYMPGIGMAQGEGHRDAPILRGNASTSDFFIDGLRDDVQYLRDVYNVEQIEALKGPNAMIFGRGGSGGVINRVTKKADWEAHRNLSLQFGDYNRSRGTADFGQALGEAVSFRVTGLYEDSESFRDHFQLERTGINPTLGLRFGEQTTLVLGYEHFRDDRTTDRGVPSQNLRPFAGDTSTFFGNPELSFSELESDAFTAILEHDFSDNVSLRNSTRYAEYSKFYQNVYPGGPSNGTTVPLSSYNSATDRENLFNQTDLVFDITAGGMVHTVLAGAEFGRQRTDNLRRSGAFAQPNGTLTPRDTVLVSNPRSGLPLVFDAGAGNTGEARVAAVYVQDQIELSPQWQAIVGARWDRFEMDFDNGRRFETRDDLFSPRVGLVYKPLEPVSLYASYTIAHVPRAGEQLSSLSLTNQAFDPEKFENVEVGAKWEIRPDLMATIAAYRLDHTNMIATDPNNPALSILIDGQRSEGIEIGLSGKITEAWSVMGGYAYQEGERRNASGAVIGTMAQLPRHSASLWNRYDFSPAWGVGLGIIHRDEVFATTSNTVVLPSFTRVDAAVFYTLNERVRMQLNVENLFDETYYASAHSNDNIMPGAPRSAYLSVNLSF